MAEGCYVAQYLAASFKGVPFSVRVASSEHGRRGAEGEFPFSDNTAYADLGIKIRRFSIEAWYLTNDHIAQAAILIAACESSGPGLLVHPTRGVILAACTKLSVKDDIVDEQGVTYLTMEFVEANPIATGLNISISLFGLSIVDISLAIGNSFGLLFDVDEVMPFYAGAVVGTVGTAMLAIATEYESAITNDPSTDRWTTLSTMTDIINDPFKVSSSSQAYSAIKRSMQALANVTTGAKKYASFKRIANKMALTSSLPDEAGEAQNAVYQSTRLLAVVHMIKAAIEAPASTLNIALRRYDAAVAILDEEIAIAISTCDEILHVSLRKFEADAKSAMLDRAYNLPALVEYDFNSAVHSLVAAYEIYGDAKRFREIEAYNSNQWPFLVGPKVIAERV